MPGFDLIARERFHEVIGDDETSLEAPELPLCLRPMHRHQLHDRF